MSLTFSVDGNYTEWTIWGPCNETCGNGSQTRYRSCINPPPSNGGRDCVGPSNETRDCFIEPCPRKFHKSNWLGYGTSHEGYLATAPPTRSVWHYWLWNRNVTYHWKKYFSDSRFLSIVYLQLDCIPMEASLVTQNCRGLICSDLTANRLTFLVRDCHSSSSSTTKLL